MMILGILCFAIYIYFSYLIFSKEANISKWAKNNIKNTLAKTVFGFTSTLVMLVIIFLMSVVVPILINNTFQVVETTHENKLNLMMFGVFIHLFILFLVITKKRTSEKIK